MNIRPSFNLPEEEPLSAKPVAPATGRTAPTAGADGNSADFSALLAADPQLASSKRVAPNTLRGAAGRRTSRPPRLDPQAAVYSPPIVPVPVATPPLATDPSTSVPDFRGMIAGDDVRASSAGDVPAKARGTAPSDIAADAALLEPGASLDTREQSSTAVRAPMTDAAGVAADPSVTASRVAPLASPATSAVGAAPVAVGSVEAAGASGAATALAPATPSDNRTYAANPSGAAQGLRPAPAAALRSGDAKAPRSPEPVKMETAPVAQRPPQAQPAASPAARTEGDATVRSAGPGGGGDKSTADGHSGSNRRSDTDADDAQTASVVRPGPEVFGAPLQMVPPSDKTLTPVNPMSPGVKAADASNDGETVSVVQSAQNQRVIRDAAHGEVEHPELGRVTVSARLREGEVDVRVTAQRSETAMFLMPRVDAMTADVRAAHVPVGRVDVDGGGGSLPQPSTASGDGSGGSARDHARPEERDGEGQVVVAPPPKRVRIVL
jgi:hypothetical protein